MDVHQGSLLAVDRSYYWYGVAYRDGSAFRPGHAFCCYRSENGVDWQEEGSLFQGFPQGKYRRPQVLYNAKNHTYVLWFWWCPQGGDGRYGVAVAKKPAGPFRLISAEVPVLNKVDGLGDFSVCADADGQAYLAYGTLRDRAVSVERLRSDYLSSTLENGQALVSGYDVLSFFRREGKYYLLLDKGDAYATQGTGMRVYVSNRPMDSYVFRRNINRYPGTPAPLAVDRALSPNLYVPLKKQSDGAFAPLEIEWEADTLFDGVKVVLFTGNRTRLPSDTLERPYAPIRLPGLEVQVWKNGGWVSVKSTQMAKTSSVYTLVDLRFDPVSGRRFRIRVATNHPYPVLVNEVEVSSRGKGLTLPLEAYVCDREDEACSPRVPLRLSGVFPLPTASGLRYCWMGDLWGSASDGIMAHDYTYWGAPLEFTPFGDVEPVRWSDAVGISLP
jgi:hypothetical protein